MAAKNGKKSSITVLSDDKKVVQASIGVRLEKGGDKVPVTFSAPSFAGITGLDQKWYNVLLLGAATIAARSFRSENVIMFKSPQTGKSENMLTWEPARIARVLTRAFSAAADPDMAVPVSKKLRNLASTAVARKIVTTDGSGKFAPAK